MLARRFTAPYTPSRHVIQEERTMETTDTRRRSRTILEGRDRAPARSYLKGMGFSDED